MKSFTFGLALVELVLVLMAIRTGAMQLAQSQDETSCTAAGKAGSVETLATGRRAWNAPGVTVSADQRVFVSFPMRSPAADGALAEIGSDGSVRPYPDQAWNAWGLAGTRHPTTHFVCVEAITCDGEGGLWALDSGRLNGKAVSDAAKLVRIDLATDRVDRVYAFRNDVAWRNSRFTGVRIDQERNAAYITDAGDGGIIVLNLETGRAHRLPEAHAGSPQAKQDLLTDLGLRSRGCAAVEGSTGRLLEGE